MQVHRFRDLVAVYTGGPTVYLSHREAAALAKAINGAAREIRQGVPFGASRVGTFDRALPPDATESTRKLEGARNAG